MGGLQRATRVACRATISGTGRKDSGDRRRTVEYSSYSEQLSQSNQAHDQQMQQIKTLQVSFAHCLPGRISTIRKPCLSVSTTRNHTGRRLSVTVNGAISQFAVAVRLYCDCANFESQRFYLRPCWIGIQS